MFITQSGTYKTYLLGYKNNEIIYSSDTISFDITKKKISLLSIGKT